MKLTVEEELEDDDMVFVVGVVGYNEVMWYTIYAYVFKLIAKYIYSYPSFDR